MDNVKRWLPLMGTVVLAVQTLALLFGENAVAGLVERVGDLVGLTADAELRAQFAVLAAAITTAGLGFGAKVLAMVANARKVPGNLAGWVPLLSVAILVATNVAAVLGYVEVANALTVLAQLAKLQADPELVAAVATLAGAATGAGVGVVRKVRAQVRDAKRCPIRTTSERRCLLAPNHPGLCTFAPKA